MGVTVTFVAILELVREGLIEIVQTEAYAPIHVRKGEGQRGLKLAVDNDARLDAAANETDIQGSATEYVDDLDDDSMDADDADLAPADEASTDGSSTDGASTDGEQHE